MNIRRDDLRLGRVGIYAICSENPHWFSPKPYPLTINRKDSKQKEQKNYCQPIFNLQQSLKKMRQSVTPIKNFKYARSLTPKINLPKSQYIQNQKGFGISKKQKGSISSAKCSNLIFIRKFQEVAPLVFIRGQIEMSKIIDSECCNHPQPKLKIQILIPKLVNYSDMDFPHKSIGFYIVGTQNPVDKSEINLDTNDYSLIMQSRIRKKIAKQSTQKNLKIEAEYEQKIVSKNVNFVIILKNEITGQVLYWRNYVDPQKLLKQLKRKNNLHKKVEQVC